jgi:hypothetical protein
MKLTDKQVKGIQDGVIEGMNNRGLRLTTRDQQLVELAITSTVYIVERISLLDERLRRK